MSDCPRVLAKEEMLCLLRSGKGGIWVDRKDAPELPELQEWEKQGLVTSTLIEYSEQYSALSFTWVPLIIRLALVLENHELSYDKDSGEFVLTFPEHTGFSKDICLWRGKDLEMIPSKFSVG